MSEQSLAARDSATEAERRPELTRSIAAPADLIAILAFALIIRIAVIFAFPSFAYPDENFQLFEQGHRLAFGYGVKPWEFDAGIRSMIPPYVLAGLFRITEPLFGGPMGYIWSAQILLACLSLAPVAAIYAMGRRESQTHAVLGALVAASWFEIVYFSFRPLTEAVAADLVMVALALASVDQAAPSRRRLAAIGICLAATLALRIHFAPGLAFIAAWIGRFEFRRRWLPMALGGAPVVALFGLVDWVTWGAPFASYVRGIQVNMFDGVAAQFGVLPWYWLVLVLAHYWSVATPAIFALNGIRARKSAIWIGFALITLASHSLIPHKEYRFIFAASACFVVVAALGSADLIEDGRLRFGDRRMAKAAVAVGVTWVAGSAALGASPMFGPLWLTSRGPIEAEVELSRWPDLCGVMLYDQHWLMSGGYAFLHRDAPFYWMIKARNRLPADGAEAFNAAIGDPATLRDLAPHYAVTWCKDGECIAERPGRCRRVADLTPILEQTRLGLPPT